MQIRFITLNIEHGGKLFENIVSFVKDEKPDILAFQEVYHSSLINRKKRFRAFSEFGKSFKKLLPFSAFQSAYFAITEIEEGAEHGNAVFSRFKIINNTKTEVGAPYGVIDEKVISDFSVTPRIMQHVELDIEGKSVNVFNLHGIWGFDGLDNEKRVEMAKRISLKIKSKKNNNL